MQWRYLVAIGVVVHACASYTDDTREIRSDFRSGRYDAALKTLEESPLKESKRNRFLYLTEKAMILDRKGDGKASRALLKQAEEVADQLYTVSITNTAASLVVNEAATDYGGEDYERVAVHLMMALSFLEDGESDSALVEARKINTKLEQINAAYGEKNKNKYGEDAFARYLAAMIYDSKGQWDSAIIDYTRALALYEGGYDRFVNGDTPEQLIKRLYALLRFRGRSERFKSFRDRFPKLTAEVDQELKQDGGYLAVVHELGQIANKETVEFPIQIGSQLVRLSFPVIAPGRSNFSKTGVTVAGKYNDAANAQDMNDIARTTLEDRRLRLIAKQGVRLLAKGQLTEQAYQNFGPIGGILANIFSVVTETADTRSWSLLPAAFDVSHVRLAPGAYKVEIYSDGKLQDVRDVTIVKDQTVLMRARGE